MYSDNFEKERLEAETYLFGKRNDFVTTYMTVANLQYIIKQEINVIDKSTITALLCVLEGSEHTSQRQVFFLYKKAADALGAIISLTDDRQLADHARNALIRTIGISSGYPHRAAAEATGACPLTIKGPSIAKGISDHIPDISWKTFLKKTGFPLNQSPKLKGRNFVISSNRNDSILVVKLSSLKTGNRMLRAEGTWMDYLRHHQKDILIRENLDIPKPIKINNSYTFILQSLPLNPSDVLSIVPPYVAMGFICHKDYFRYPNEPCKNNPISQEELIEIIKKNAFYLGHLSSIGIIHTAPIPLFHNRVQRERRNDHGFYEWRRGGRLDRWLASCKYPNVGKTGIRDFEHIVSFNGSARKLYEHIGKHIFSLILIAGSYFRNHYPDRIGFDENCQPIDVRDLFALNILKRSLNEIFNNYYLGFTGTEFNGSPPIDMNHLARRLVEELGVDRHMEEILRVAEQDAMCEQEFSDFLKQRGYSEKQLQDIRKGETDISILTGPHLGGFNQQISIPELIEFTASLSAICIADRFYNDKFINPQLS